MDDEHKCKVIDDKFVEPCITLRKIIGKSSIEHPQMTIMGKRSRSFIQIKTKGEHKYFCFNFCPFCGEPIWQPFMKD